MGRRSNPFSSIWAKFEGIFGGSVEPASPPQSQILKSDVGNVPEELGQDLHDKNDGKAIILPVLAREFIGDLLIGPRVSDDEVENLTGLLRDAGLAERVRRLKIGT
jgi:hypothetical protein